MTYIEQAIVSFVTMVIVIIVFAAMSLNKEKDIGWITTLPIFWPIGLISWFAFLIMLWLRGL